MVSQSPPKYRTANSAATESSDSESSVASRSNSSRPQRETDYASYMNVGRGLSSSANVTPNGTITVKLDLKHKLPDLPKEYAQEVKEFAVEDDELEWRRFPSLNIVIMIVGSRGDVQPYIALGKRLITDGHRVRLASHETFRSFVNEHGLEFFDIGGDPADLMSYMVKNPGLIPGMSSLTNGDIPRKRVMLKTMIGGCFEACYAADQKTGKPFAADAIISNPPAFAHVHCAEALGVPLLLSFTMPWTPTTAFPHPLVNVKQTNAEPGLTNYLTYPLAELMTWQGIGDIINEFRKKTLGLSSLNAHTGPGVADTLKVPWTYCMSSALVPKPHDWRNHIDVTGFYFLDLASNYAPPADLAAFLATGPVPIYIGFGSVVVDDPVAMTKTIFEATKQAGVRLLLSSGWAKLGQCGDIPLPSHVFILGNVPHDWLFSGGRVAAVVHHGGAGTTAAGLACGLPTLVVPFFGDQGFWGGMIARAGAGPQPIAPEKLTDENGKGVNRLREAIEVLVSDEAKAAAKSMGESIKNEDGVNKGAGSFYKHLPLKNMRCDLDPGRVAVWWSTEHCLKLSAFAAQVLSEASEINMNTLELHRAKEYDPRKPVSDPISGGGTAIFWTITHYYAGIAEIFYSPIKGIIHTTTAIPKGVMKIFSSVHEGLHNVPKLYGTEVRSTGKVTDFGSGVREGGKSLVHGYYDGITGLVREPINGGKKEGFVGVLKGSARVMVNATMLPAAGIAGFISQPLQGAIRSMRPGTPSMAWERQLRLTRIKEGMDAVKASTGFEKGEIVRKFWDAKETVGERKKELARLAVEEAKVRSEIVPGPSEKKEKEKATRPPGQRRLSLSSFSSSTDSTPMPSAISTPASSPAPSYQTLQPVDSSAATAQNGALNYQQMPPPAIDVEQEEDSEAAAFLRDLELAKQLSEASSDEEHEDEEMKRAIAASLMEQ